MSAGTLQTVQAEHADWLKRNFGHLPESELRSLTLIGVMEELGELSRAHLKSGQEVNPSPEWEGRGRDAVGEPEQKSADEWCGDEACA